MFMKLLKLILVYIKNLTTLILLIQKQFMRWNDVCFFLHLIYSNLIIH